MAEPTPEQMRCGRCLYGPPALCTCGTCNTTDLPADVVRLVIAARRAFDLGYDDEEFRELDQALEAFASRVPYDDED